jgi:hypothetical protein
MDLTEAVTYLARERQALYLDGPEDVDWIFRNAIEQRREEAIYVYYIAIRDYWHDEHQWHCPNPELLGMYLQTSCHLFCRQPTSSTSADSPSPTPSESSPTSGGTPHRQKHRRGDKYAR